MNYYNDSDKHAVGWLRNLARDGFIPAGNVDERPIQQVEASDLHGYTQHHFFAGIAGWSKALQLAGWPTTVPVWTASCPCQPLSCAGKRLGEKDERHLWPELYRLVSECRPNTIFGEQVASADGLEWIDGISLDLEEIGYAVAACDLPAASVNAPHRRQRLYWVAHAECESRWRFDGDMERATGQAWQPQDGRANGNVSGSSGEHASRLAHSTDGRSTIEEPRPQSWSQCGSGHETVGNTTGEGPQEQWREYQPSGSGCSGLSGLAMQAGVPQWNGPTIAVRCSDGSRRVSAEPNSFPLAHGLSGRVGVLRGAGNAIVPQVAAEWIRAFMEST